MKLKDLASKPKLILVTVDDPAIVQAYGEPIEFWTWDRQPLTTFMKFASASGEDLAAVIGVLRTMMLDEDGKEIMSDEETLPNDVLLVCLNRLSEVLGK